VRALPAMERKQDAAEIPCPPSVLPEHPPECFAAAGVPEDGPDAPASPGHAARTAVFPEVEDTCSPVLGGFVERLHVSDWVRHASSLVAGTGFHVLPEAPAGLAAGARSSQEEVACFLEESPLLSCLVVAVTWGSAERARLAFLAAAHFSHWLRAGQEA